MTSEPLSSSSSAPAEVPAKSQKKGVPLDWVRRVSVFAGVALLFIVFSVLTQSFYQPGNLLDSLLQA
jgi:ribose/xylose/arabinose/galactoside ABC-type transport system permease subunit